MKKLDELFRKIRLKALSKTYIPQSILKKFDVKIDKRNAKIIISKKK